MMRIVMALGALHAAAAPPTKGPPTKAPTTTAPSSNTLPGAGLAPCHDVPPPTVPTRPSSVRVMLPDVQGADRYRDARIAFGQIIAEEAGRVKGYELLSAAEVRAVIDQESAKQLVGCDDTGCLAELAEALDAELIVSGRVDVGADGSPLVSLSLVNARALVVVNRVTTSWTGNEAQLPDVVRTSAQRLLVARKERQSGMVRIAGAPPGARVVIDGEDHTQEHAAGQIGGLDVGVHEVSIEAPEYLPRTLPIVVIGGQETIVDGTLEATAVAGGWWWLGGAAAVLTGAVVTGAALYWSGRGDVDVVATLPSAGINDVEAVRGVGK